MQTSQEIWNSLEIVKLAVAGLTPLVLILIGYLLSKRLQKVEQLQWANQRLIETRIEFYSRTAPLLNDLLCFYTYVGNWKSHSPNAIVELKRQLDKEFHVNAPLFPGEVLVKYLGFMELCFKTFAGWGRDARLRTHFGRRVEAMGDCWQDGWNDLFVPDESVEPVRIRDAYDALLLALAGSLGIGANLAELPKGQIPYGSHRG